MWAANPRSSCPKHGRAIKQGGTAAVEFAVLVGFFLALVFGILEIARMVYLFNTLQEVTRRAAALAIDSPFDAGTQESIRKQALFPDSQGNLLFGAPVTPAHLRIDYLALTSNGAGVLQTPAVSALPASPARNRLNCLTNPYADNCIRFVRVQICQPNGTQDCEAVPYETVFPLISLPLTLPRSLTIRPAQTMGYEAGDEP